jgi:hypothetical protein
MASRRQRAVSPKSAFALTLGRPRSEEVDMADTPEWKRTLRESNALGWIALIAVVAVIGISTMFFGKAPANSHSPAAANHSSPRIPGK